MLSLYQFTDLMVSNIHILRVSFVIAIENDVTTSWSLNKAKYSASVEESANNLAKFDIVVQEPEKLFK